MPDNQVTLKPEDLAALQAFQSKFSRLLNRKGLLHFQETALRKEIAIIDAALEELENSQSLFVEKLQETYGVGQVDITTGVFTPSPQPVSSEKTQV